MSSAEVSGEAFETLLEEYRRKKLSLMEFIISVLLYSPYRIRFYDTKVHLQKTSEFWGLCDELAKAGTITRAENKAHPKESN